MSTEDNVWYSSHGQSMLMSDFIDLEIEDRGNYTNDEVDAWFELYDIGLNAIVIWVTNLDKCIDEYCDLANPIRINPQLIIEESDDGDEGYLAVIGEHYAELV